MTIRVLLSPLGCVATVLLFASSLRPLCADALESQAALTQCSHQVWRVGDANLVGVPRGIAQTTDGYIWISAGSYTFRLLARNNDGVGSEAAAAVTFTRSPAWYWIWMFRAFILGGSVALLLLVYLYLLRFYAKSLERRFDERLRERTRLARDLHDTLLQTIQGCKMMADDAREHVDDPRLTGR
jgi:hypothetical protein